MILGRIYHAHATASIPPKNKFMLCICHEHQFVMWINSKPRHHKIGQFPLSDSDHAVIKHDSFLDCSKIWKVTADRFLPVQDRGPISVNLANRLVDFLRRERPKTLTPILLDMILNNLSSLH